MENLDMKQWNAGGSGSDGQSITLVDITLGNPLHLLLPWVGNEIQK
jgi:hypothetical protein